MTKITAEMEGRYAMDLAKRLKAADEAQDLDAMVELENEILALLDFDLNETEQGLTHNAAHAIAKFCRDQGVT